MATITGIVFVKRIPLTAVAGGLVIEVWKVPASTDADTQDLVLPHIKTVLGIVGPLEMVAQTADSAITVITTATIDASNFTHALIIGTE